MSDLVIYAVVAGVGIVASLGYKLFAGDPVRKVLRRHKPVSIRSAVHGTVVTVAGEARSTVQPLIAPLSARACIAWRVIVEERRRGMWSEIIFELRAIEFLLRDETGKAFVQPHVAMTSLADDVELRCGATQDATDVIEAFLARHHHTSRGLVLTRELRLREAVVASGDRLVVRGHATWEPDPDPDPGSTTGYRETPTRLTLAASERTYLYVGDESVVTRD